MKKAFITLIALFLSLVASAAVQYNGLWYNLNTNDNTAEVVASQGSQYSGDISIPTSVYYQNTFYKVISIGNSAFEGCVDITSVSLPNSLTNIGNGAFWQCSSLKSVVIPDGVLTIGEGAFRNCYNLASVVIPNSVTSIGSNAFGNCNNLNQVFSLIRSPFAINQNIFTTYSTATLFIPKGTKSAYQAISGWKKFTNIYDGTTADPTKRTIHVATAGTLSYLIPEDEKYLVEELTLSGELNGTDFRLIRDMAGIDSHLGSGGVRYTNTSGKLKTLDFSNASIVEGGSYYMEAEYTGPTCIECSDELYTQDNCISRQLFYKTKLESIIIPNNVTSIGEKAFGECSGLTSFVIPQSVKSIQSDAFMSCANLVTISVESGNLIYDSRNNCNAIIETKSNTLIIGSGNTIIPNNVTSIGSGAFSGCSSLTSITIPNSVTSIGYSAFYNCSGLTSLTLPNSVTTIAENTFGGCRGLTSLTLPNSVTSVGGSAFSGCNGLTSLTLSNSVTSIGEGAFSHCSGLTSITIPSSVTSIGRYAFSYCSGLTSITIPSSVTSIGEGAFYDTRWYNNQPDGLLYAGNVAYKYKGTMSNNTSIIIKDCTVGIAGSAFSGCSGLTSVTIPNSVRTIGEWAFSGCSGLTSLTIPNSVTSIDRWAFSGCSGLTSITIPNSVTSIGDYAFGGCSGLTTIATEIENPFVISDNVFYCYDKDIYATATLIVPLGKKSVYQNTTGWNKFQNIIEVGGLGYEFEDNGIRYKIGENNTVSVIGPSDFSGDIVIPNQVCFNGAVYLVTSIEESAFYHWPYDESTKSVTIPSSITSVGSEAFGERIGLTAVHISDLEAWCKIRFSGDGSNPLESAHHLYLNGTEINDLVIPNSVTTIKDRAFWGCSCLTSLTIPNSVTSIGDGAFRSCSGLTALTIPNSVTSIGSSAFDNCTGLTSVTIPNSVTSIEPSTFANCSGLTSITIPNSVTSIGNAAFMSCGLTSVIIPPSVSSIRYYAFEACPLTDFYCLAEKVPSTPESFIDWDDLHHITLYVPAKSIELYKTANLWKDFKYIREIIAGDMNLNNVVDKNDLNALVDFVMGKDVQGFYKCLADLNGDDKVNAADVVKLITILNIQEGLSTDWQFNYNSSQVVSSLNCTLNNDGDKAIQLTKCELYCNQILAGSANFKVTLGTGGSKSCTFSDLSSFSTKTGFSVVWYYTYNGESYTYRCDLTE